MIFFIDRCSFSVQRRWNRLEVLKMQPERVKRIMDERCYFADTILHGGYTSFKTQSIYDDAVVNMLLAQEKNYFFARNVPFSPKYRIRTARRVF